MEGEENMTDWLRCIVCGRLWESEQQARMHPCHPFVRPLEDSTTDRPRRGTKTVSVTRVVDGIRVKEQVEVQL